MNKMMRMLLVLCLLMLVTVSALAEGTIRYIVSEDGKTVNIRSGPGTKYHVVTRVKSGTQVEAEEANDGWCEVTYQGKKGYVKADFVTSKAPAATAKPDEPAGNSTVVGTLAYVTSSNGKSVNLRSGPGKTYDEVGEAQVGKDVTVLKKGSTWSRIRVDGRECYIMTRFLSSHKAYDHAGSDRECCPKKTETAYVYSKNGAPVRVRKGAGSSYSVVGEVAYGIQVQVDGTKGKWSHITYETGSGYIMSSYLTSEKPEPYATATPKPTATPKATETMSERAYVVSANGKSVNVRKSAKNGAKVITSLDVGTQVTVTQRGTRWSRVTGSFGEGYMLNQYLSANKPEITPAPTATASASYTAYVYSSNGKSVRMRQKASNSGKTVRILDVGTEVTVIGATNNWYKIRVDSVEGYMLKSFISETKPVTQEESKVKIAWVPSVGSRVYLASSSSRVVRTFTSQGGNSADGKAYPVGTPATVKSVDEAEKWAKVSINGTECYLRFSSLAKTAAAAIPESANRLINYLKSSGGNVELRRAKFEGSGTLGYFIPGTGVIVLSRNADEGWAYIQVGGTKGYVDLNSLSRNP